MPSCLQKGVLKLSHTIVHVTWLLLPRSNRKGQSTCVVVYHRKVEQLLESVPEWLRCLKGGRCTHRHTLIGKVWDDMHFTLSREVKSARLDLSACWSVQWDTLLAEERAWLGSPGFIEQRWIHTVNLGSSQPRWFNSLELADISAFCLPDSVTLPSPRQKLPRTSATFPPSPW